ncbi:MAG: tRNA (adenosine(37)-N6)-dimethylallyltransferase MiaA [Gammaproteobacteria bacterium]
MPDSVSSDLPPAIFLMGPTASGKTDLAVILQQEMPCEIISVDSAMIYRGMDIGTAKPDAELLNIAPHRLINICDPSESYSAERFRQDALQEMADIHAKGAIPLLVGGTFLYFRALEQGLSRLPSADEGVRERLEQQALTIGWQGMHERLAQIDPTAAARIHPNDPQRIQRALEIYEITGLPMTELLKKAKLERVKSSNFPYHAVKIIISPPDRADLYRRIDQRFDDMLDEGFIDEVETLYRRGDLTLGMPSMRAVGYRQVWHYLDGTWDYATMRDKAMTASRHYAKRQLTWLRSETGGTWYDPLRKNIHKEVLKKLNANVMLST